MFIKKRSVLGLVIVLSCCILLGCQNKDKEVVISNDVSKQVREQEEEVSQKIELGNSYLKQQKYDKARKAYEEAISKEPSNKKIYIEIKDKYIEKSRFDDAYYIIKLAINNNVDVQNMKGTLEEIKKNFETISLESSVYQNDSFNLPKKVNLVVNGEQIQADVKWNTSNVDTSNAGTFTYTGTIEQYGRNVQQNLIVKVNGEVYSSQKLGFSITFPRSWKDKYTVKESNDGITVYFIPSDTTGVNIEGGEGYLFAILKKSDQLNEDQFDTVSTKRRYFDVNGTTYVIGGPTGVGYDPSHAEYDTYMKMHYEIEKVVDTIKVLQ